MKLATPTSIVGAASTAAVEAATAASTMEAATATAVETATTNVAAVEAAATTEAWLWSAIGSARGVEVTARSAVVVHARRVGEGARGAVGAWVVEVGRV